MGTPIKLTHSSPQITAESVRRTVSDQGGFDFEIVDDHYRIYISQGQTKLEFTSDGKTLHKGMVFPGMMRLAAPGEKVHIEFYAHCEAVTLNVPGSFLRETLRSLKDRHEPGRFSYVDPFLQPRLEVAQLGRILLDHQQFDPAHEDLFVRGIAETLLTYLLRNHGSSPGKSFTADRLTDRQLRQAMDFADANMETLLTLERWAGALGMPVDEFRRRFRRSVGAAPYAWYLDRRIERAKTLLVGTRESLAQIALRVGFSSQSHFTEAFRQREGMPPARWRGQQPGAAS